MAFRVLPEYIVEDIVDSLRFFVQLSCMHIKKYRDIISFIGSLLISLTCRGKWKC